MNDQIRKLIMDEDAVAKDLETIVENAILNEKILTNKLLEVERDDQITFGQKISDMVAGFGGSWLFIIGFVFFIFGWILFNIFWLNKKPFDPYPFILLNLILSTLAAFQAPIIMMSQNRQEEKDRRRARSDYMINLKAEMEIRNLHDKLDAFYKTHQKILDILTKEKN